MDNSRHYQHQHQHQHQHQQHDDDDDDDELIFERCKHRTAGDQGWEKVRSGLQSDPSFMTSRVMIVALHNKPPKHVVEFMLELNPRAAAIPKEGPTPLEIAIKHHSSVDVIVLLLLACPLALAAGDMVEVARKAGRGSETDLMDALLKPLKCWLAESSTRYNKRGTTGQEATVESAQSLQDVSDFKAIASSLVKAQKRQDDALALYEQEIENKFVDAGTNLVHQFEDRHRRHFQKQLVALDMKEKSLQHQHSLMERRIIKSLEMSKKTRHTKYEEAIQKLESKVTELETRLEQECRVNTYFRSDTRLHLDQITREPAWAAFDDDPIVYSTPFDLHLDGCSDGDESVEPLFKRHETPSQQARARKGKGKAKQGRRYARNLPKGLVPWKIKA